MMFTAGPCYHFQTREPFG